MGLRGEDVGSGGGADLTKSNGLASGKRKHVGVIFRLEFAVYVHREDIGELRARVVVGDGASVAAGGIDAPNPDEVVEVVEVDVAVVELTVEGRGAIFAGTASPPEPVTVHLVIGAEENGDMGIAQLLEVSRDDVDLGAPAAVKIGAGREELVPFEVGEMTLDAVAEANGLIVGRADGMPGEGNDGSVLVLALDLGDHGRAGFDGVFVLGRGEAEVLAEERGIFAGEIVGPVGPAGCVVGKIVLSGHGVVAGDGIEVANECPGFRGCLGIYRPERARRGRLRNGLGGGELRS